MFDRLARWWTGKPLSDEAFAAERDRLVEKTPVPVFWLFGKTGSGKSSIVRALTGATTAEIGNGFRPQTQTSSEFDFPTADEPVVRFLDTRGVGEAHYDPTADLQAFSARTHVVIVTVRVADQALEAVLEPLRRIRQAAPERPIILALTCLHEAYPTADHPRPDPFAESPVTTVSKDRPVAFPERLPGELGRLLAAQAERFRGLVDRIVPLDFTAESEGFSPPLFGLERLEATLLDVLPSALRQALVYLPEVRDQLRTLVERQAWPVILTHASLAATAAATPIPWADIPAVLAVQTRLVYRLADLYGQRLQVDEFLKMAAALSGQILARFALRAPLKFIPFVGMSANAALAFAYTFSLGKACCWYFGEIKQGHVPSQGDLNRVWNEKLQDAVAIWKRDGQTVRRSKPQTQV